MNDHESSSLVLAFLINHLWQATLFAGFVSVLTLFLRRAPARVRYALWIVASLKFLVPSALFIFIAEASGFDVTSVLLSMAWATGDPVWLLDHQHQLFFLAGQHGFANAPLILKLVTLVWLTGTVVLLSIWCHRRLAFYRGLRRGQQLTSGREFDMLQSIKAKLRVRRKIGIMVSDMVSEPGVWGISNPVILFPENMAQTLGDSELETVFLHEMAHIMRWDNLIGSVQMVVSSLFWFHPLVWWIDRRLLAEREHACDDRVIECGGPSREYARGLMKVLQFGLGFRVAGVSCAGGSDLRKRIENIVSGPQKRRLELKHRLVLASGIIMALVASVAAVELSECDRFTLKERVTTIAPSPDAAVSSGPVTVESCPNET